MSQYSRRTPRCCAPTPDLQVNVEGKCDEHGSHEYNWRCDNVAPTLRSGVLILLGVSAPQVHAVSFGSESPNAKGHSEEDLGQNRRSDMVHAGAALSK